MSSFFDVNTFGGTVVATLVAGSIVGVSYWLWTSYLNARPVRLVLDSERLRRVRSEWSSGPDGPNTQHATITTIRLEVAHSRSKAIHVKAIVEEISGMANPIGQPALQVSDQPTGDTLVEIPPSRWWHSVARRGLFDFVEFCEGSEWASFCFAIPSHECLVPRQCRVTVRFDAGGETVGREMLEVRTHEAGGIPIPISIKLVPRQNR